MGFSPQDRQILCDLLRHFYRLGWCSGTGGGIAIRHGDECLVAPSGVQKERVAPGDLFVLGLGGEVIDRPLHQDRKLSECWPLFKHPLCRGAGAVIHSHSINVVLATKKLMRDASVYDGDRYPDSVLMYHFVIPPGYCEMVKGLRGKGYYDEIRIPCIDNTAHEPELEERLNQALNLHPDVDVVVVRNHGMYVWGKDWAQAKAQAECLDYLFELWVKDQS